MRYLEIYVIHVLCSQTLFTFITTVTNNNNYEFVDRLGILKFSRWIDSYTRYWIIILDMQLHTSSSYSYIFFSIVDRCFLPLSQHLTSLFSSKHYKILNKNLKLSSWMNKYCFAISLRDRDWTSISIIVILFYCAISQTSSAIATRSNNNNSVNVKSSLKFKLNKRF